MPQTTDAYDFHGRTLVASDGDKIGKIDEVYTDAQGGQPEWALVNTGLFGSKKTFVPIARAQPAGESLQVPVTKDKVREAPRIDADHDLSEDEERRLFEHYGIPYTTEGTTTAAGTEQRSDASNQRTGDGAQRGSGTTGGPGRDVSGPETDEAMTRSEEQVRVGTQQREAGRVRLRKYVVTEQVTQTVPVSHEEVRVEREPITDANRDQALSGADISEEEHEVVLHAEEPVVEKRTVPKERVRLDTETVTEDREVSEEVRKERIETEGADRPDRR